MSTATPVTPPRPVAVVVPPVHRNEIRIISHSTLFYWWPVWALGFLMALVTLFSGQYMITVPANSTFREGVEVKDTKELRTVVVISKEGEKHLPKDTNGKPVDPHLHMASSKTPGVLFCIVILLVITITSVPL